MGSFAAQKYLLDHSAGVDAVVLSGTAALDLLAPAIDLDQPVELAGFNAPFAPARTEYDWFSRDQAEVDAYVADPACGFGLDPGGGKGMFSGPPQGRSSPGGRIRFGPAALRRGRFGRIR